MITVEHLTKCYGDFTAVSNLSFEIEEGHVYGFLGPNGAGKSTTMNIMTGCLSATEGCVRIGGYDIFEEPDKAKRLIGYLPEQPPLYMNETPVEYLKFVGEAKGLRGRELTGQIEAVISQTRLEDVKNRLISKLSKGYRQRVGIAQALLGNPKVVLNALKEDITIYWIVQSDEEDDVIENLLAKYENLSEHIEVVKKNPDIYPTFAEQYTSEEVQNNSLVVECGERSRFIGYSDIYLYEADMGSYSYDVSFDGEGAITSAIDYVVNEDQPKLYVLEGHGEKELSAVFSEQIEKENIELSQFSLLTADAVPEDADGILIYAPDSDISEEEKNLLTEYVSGGGKLMVMAGPTEDGSLTNLYSILADYGVETVDGIVVDTDRGHYAFQAPYILLPDIVSSEITDPLIEENYYAIMPISQGLIVQDTATAAVTQLLTTSESSFSKSAGYALSSYEKEEGDIDGPFALAVSIAAENDGRIVWFASSSFMDDMYNAYSSGANLDMAMNALSSIIGESEAVAIRSKSLNYNYLTISDSTSSLLKTIMIAVFPLLYLEIGICVTVGRRKMNEAK